MNVSAFQLVMNAVIHVFPCVLGRIEVVRHGWAINWLGGHFKKTVFSGGQYYL